MFSNYSDEKNTQILAELYQSEKLLMEALDDLNFIPILLSVSSCDFSTLDYFENNKMSQQQMVEFLLEKFARAKTRTKISQAASLIVKASSKMRHHF